MPRVSKGAATRQARKRLLKSVRGRRGSMGLYRLAKESATRGAAFAKVGRRLKKRDFRGLWIIRISAACKQRGIRYSQFINGLKKAKIEINRKMLSEIAIADPAGFDKIVEAANGAN